CAARAAIRLGQAGARTPVAALPVSVVAVLARQLAPVAAHRATAPTRNRTKPPPIKKSARARTAVAVRRIAVIASFANLDDPVAAPEAGRARAGPAAIIVALDATQRVAAVARERVRVVALFAQGAHAVTARGRLITPDARDAARVAHSADAARSTGAQRAALT